METGNDRLLRYVRIGVWLVGALLAVAVIALVVLLPRVSQTLDRAMSTFEQMQTVLARVDELSVKADEALETATAALESATAAADNANKLVVDNSDAVSEAMAKFNSVDFEALNRAINDLADIVEPLARVSNFLGGSN